VTARLTGGVGNDAAIFASRSAGKSSDGGVRESRRSLGTSGVARRTASGVRGGDALVMSGTSSVPVDPKRGNSGVGAGGGLI